MLARVRQRLLDDAIRRQVDAGRQRHRLALRSQLDPKAARAGLLHELAHVAQPRLRRQRCVGVRPAQDAKRAAHLVERVAPRALDRLQRFARALGVAVEHRPRALRLRHHPADAVRDDVVQLARDPRPLLADRGALALQRLLLEQRQPLRPGPRAAADEPRRRDDQPAGEQESCTSEWSLPTTEIQSPATPSAAPTCAARSSACAPSE